MSSSQQPKEEPREEEERYIDPIPIKLEIYEAAVIGGGDKAFARYWEALEQFLGMRRSHEELQEVVEASLGVANVHLHNTLVLALLHNSHCTRVPASLLEGMRQGATQDCAPKSGDEGATKKERDEEDKLDIEASMRELFGTQSDVWESGAVDAAPVLEMTEVKGNGEDRRRLCCKRKKDDSMQSADNGDNGESSASTRENGKDWLFSGGTKHRVHDAAPPRVPGAKVLAPFVQAIANHRGMQVQPQVLQLINVAATDYCKQVLAACVECARSEVPHTLGESNGIGGNGTSEAVEGEEQCQWCLQRAALPEGDDPGKELAEGAKGGKGGENGMSPIQIDGSKCTCGGRDSGSDGQEGRKALLPHHMCSALTSFKLGGSEMMKPQWDRAACNSLPGPGVSVAF